MTATAAYAARARATGLTVVRWWWRETRSLIPERLKAFFEPEDRRLTARFDGQVLCVLTAEEGHEAGDSKTENFDLSDLQAADDNRLVSLLAGHEVDVLLDENLTIFAEVEFPRLSGRRLDQAIHLRAATLFPLKLSELSLAHRLLPPAGDKDTRIEIAATKRSTIDTLLNHLKKIQAVTRLLPERFSEEQSAHSFSSTASPWRWGSLSSAGMLGLAALFMLALSPIIYWARLEIAIANLEEANQALRVETAPLIEVIEKEREDRLVANVINAELARPGTAVILERLSAILSDDHSLVEYRQMPGEVRLRGVGPDPAGLIPLIENEAFTTGTQLLSATNRADGNRQDYQIAFDLAAEDSS